MRKRTQSLKKYGISPKRYKELCGFCEQYGEWKDELKSLDNPLKSPKYDGMPHGKGNTSDPTFALATKRAMLKEKSNWLNSVPKKLILSSGKKSSSPLATRSRTIICIQCAICHLELMLFTSGEDISFMF